MNSIFKNKINNNQLQNILQRKVSDNILSKILSDIVELNPGWLTEEILRRRIEYDDNYDNYGAIKNVYFGQLEIRILPESIKNLTVTNNLDLSHNRITRLPDNFYKIKVGGELNLCGNGLISLPNNFNLINVKNIDLTYNGLLRNNVPDHFPNVRGVIWS